MLKAINANGTAVIAKDIEDKASKFSCPDCKGEAIFVDAVFRVKHFRHSIANRNCNPEPETQRHMQMKERLMKFFSVGPEYVEVSLGFAKPDLLINKVAIECQASPISTAKLISRSYAYHKHGYFVLWVFDLPLSQKSLFNRIVRRMYFNRVYVMHEDKIVALQWNGALQEVISPKLVTTQGSLPEKLIDTFPELMELPLDVFMGSSGPVLSRKINIARFTDKYLEPMAWQARSQALKQLQSKIGTSTSTETNVLNSKKREDDS